MQGPLSGHVIDPEPLKAYCREALTGYKQPRHIEFRTELPKTNVGKILRKELRDPAPATGAATDAH